MRRFFWFKGITGISHVGISKKAGVFARVVIGLRRRELSEHNETKIYLKYFGVTRRGLKFPDKPNVYCTKSIRTTDDEKKRIQFTAHKRV